jgi:outer membrane lipoprotein SlyB
MSILDPVKQVSAKVTTNPIGAVAGAAAGYFACKKFMPKVCSKWYGTAAVVVAGALVGAYAQSMITAKGGLKKSNNAAKGK